MSQLHTLSRKLIQKLEGCDLLDSRYAQLELINCVGGHRRGNFSLVFRAWDVIEEQFVAIKFFDIDPQRQCDYRKACFEREHNILFTLRGMPRCLQLLGGLKEYQFEIELSDGDLAPFTAVYFVTEWLDQDVEDYFLDNCSFDALSKLKLFREIVLSVRALHSATISHRDLKSDNIRKRVGSRGEEGVAIVVDMGTAALAESPAIESSIYELGPVGMLRYAAPEAHCGLSGNRAISKYQDIFGLGCLLFEMFSLDDYLQALLTANPDYEIRLAALKSALAAEKPTTLVGWDREAPKILAGMNPLGLDNYSSLLPEIVFREVEQLVARLTAPNFRNRTADLNSVISSVDVCLQILRSQRASIIRSERARLIRSKRREAALRREAVMRPEVRLDTGGR